ncbi:aldose epimerase family protein [Kitasatospora aureofaciens]|uniref:Aldose 1-epimerase n=1 Tax=Kitasatospora aureofaciens TaxID=1894 RepID=A0A1E7NCZ8_KITAU|nr:aldose epimerase family protein [Kitasatospora aureofaciens]ARF77585.1 galactose-1-epimerase [Kitasatospora aureofaciens]OEV38562.1 galactose mutarotase [Kitasatospora aureofaciens]GGU75571.1 aldose 1-epimerase [Kitasatospora aureofaciens]
MPSEATTVRREPLDPSGAGAAIQRWTLTAGPYEASVLTLGATLHTLSGPDRSGRTAQLLLSTDELAQILGPARHYGTVVGRYANRIDGSSVTIDGQNHPLAPTGGGMTIHGGPDGFAQRMWAAEPVEGGVLLRLHSPDGDQGFPGALDVTVSYTLSYAPGAGGELVIDYRAVTNKPTVVNLTNHAYFNLAGEGSGDVLGHLLTLDADEYTPADERQIPYGRTEPVAGTPFDFTVATPIGKSLHDDHPQLAGPGGYDHNWALRARPASGGPARAALLEDPVSGRTLEVLTTEPGLQVYTANKFQGAVTGASGVPYGPFAGIALETQHFPDSPHHPAFPSTELRPEEEFRSTTVLRLGVS